MGNILEIKDLSKNFKGLKAVDGVSFWLLTTKFLGRSLYRARETPNFTSRTVRNNLNDGRARSCVVAVIES